MTKKQKMLWMVEFGDDNTNNREIVRTTEDGIVNYLKKKVKEKIERTYKTEYDISIEVKDEEVEVNYENKYFYASSWFGLDIGFGVTNQYTFEIKATKLSDIPIIEF